MWTRRGPIHMLRCLVLATAGCAGGDSAGPPRATGGQYTCGVTSTNKWYCWGANDKGQFGNGSSGNSWTPTRVPNP